MKSRPPWSFLGKFDVLTSRRYSNEMNRATIYLDPALHRALRLKAAECDKSVSELVNVAVRNSLLEDAADLAVFKERRRRNPSSSLKRF